MKQWNLVRWKCCHFSKTLSKLTWCQYWEEYQYHSLFSWYLHIWHYGLWRRYHNTSFQCVPCVTVSPHSHYHNIASRNTQQKKNLQFCNYVGKQIIYSDAGSLSVTCEKPCLRAIQETWLSQLRQWFAPMRRTRQFLIFFRFSSLTKTSAIGQSRADGCCVQRCRGFRWACGSDRHRSCGW